MIAKPHITVRHVPRGMLQADFWSSESDVLLGYARARTLKLLWPRAKVCAELIRDPASKLAYRQMRRERWNKKNAP